jgi:LysR family transcriptional regulator, transcription activator of glutamate synthase operon
MDMDTSVLRWFQQVADGTTVTEVSELEGITQSGVSRALARLETEVGTPMLVRSGRTLRMTRAGVTFKRHLDRALHELDDGLAALSELTSPDTGTVAIAFQLSLGTWLVPQLVAGFHRRHPAVQFELHQIRDELISPRFLDGIVDLEITTVAHPGPGVGWRPLLVEPLLVAVPREHALADLGSIHLEALRDERFVMLRPTYALREASEELCRRSGFDPLVAFEGDDLPTVEGFVGAGLGVAIVPGSRREISDRSSATVSYLGIVDPGASRAIGVAWSTERPPLPAAQRFIEHVIHESRNISRTRQTERALR